MARLRDRIEKASHPICDGPVIWPSSVPLKVACFVWRTKANRIPSAAALIHCGVNLGSNLCSLCICAEETTDHILVSCPFTNLIWKMVWDWCGIQAPVIDSVRDALDFSVHWGRDPKKKKVLLSIVFGAFWSLWRYRNDKIF